VTVALSQGMSETWCYNRGMEVRRSNALRSLTTSSLTCGDTDGVLRSSKAKLLERQNLDGILNQSGHSLVQHRSILLTQGGQQ
jgi:hypothetical protein